MKQRNSGAIADGSSENGRKFYDYYAAESKNERTLRRFESIYAAVTRMLRANGAPTQSLEVADIGCGAGTQCLLWAERGHKVHGVDINEPLLELAERRSRDAGLKIDFRPGSATALPWERGSMDVCLMPELLEHVPEWQCCLDECARVLKRGGLLYISTTNRLCPYQEEFDLPLYSWYPRILKRRYERLAVTTRPQLVNHAEYPAIHWFSFYRLRESLAAKGFACHDRFDVTDLDSKSLAAKSVILGIRALSPLRFFAHMATPYTVVLAFKRDA